MDTTVSPEDSSVKSFYPAGVEDSGRNDYTNGDLIRTNNDGNSHVYVFDSSYTIQYSTSDKNGQNQPGRQGYNSQCKVIYNGTGKEEGGNIYFFYTRERFVLDIQNVNGRYEVPKSLLEKTFDCLSKYGNEISTLKQLGWDSVNSDGTVSIRYGGNLTPLSEEEIINWLTKESGGNLEYPYSSAGESQYYFWRWYRNQMQTIPVEWETDNEIRTMTSNKTLYAGWFTPRYTTSYVLNGGSWTDSIDYTLTTKETADGQTVYIYYPHQAQEESAPLYWYVQSKENDRLYVDKLYVCQVSDVAHRSETGDHWELNESLSVDEMLEHSTEDFQGSRLVDHYYCYMGQGIQYSHEYYVNINSAVNTVLEEPREPERAGYTFSGWFYFDKDGTFTGKTYLKDVLTDNQSLDSYQEGYVYINHVGDAFLLHKDDGGLYYYSDQTGYHFSYDNEASVVTRDLQLYAAWSPKGDATGVVYHLIKVSDVGQLNTFTPNGETDPITISDSTDKIEIGGNEYYVLKKQDLSSLYTGSTYPQTAWEYCTDNTGRKWLPEQASIDLEADERTQTVTENNLSSVTGNTYRIQQADGSYIYYSFFVYESTDEVVYNVYKIDLAVAVAEGKLHSYQETFDRYFQVDETDPYFLGKEQKSVKVNDDLQTTVVTENAPSVSGYSVYQDWSQSLQLQTDSSANNIFFYYVGDDAGIHYNITFYLMQDGNYSSNNKVTISHIPAVTGEIIPLTDMASAYNRLVTIAQTYSEYENSQNEAQSKLYDRYKEMVITWTNNGNESTFTVKTGDMDSLNLSDIQDFCIDYYVDSYTPTGSNLVVSDGANVEVYLASAQLIVQKVDSNQLPLEGAKFSLERLVESENGDISYGGKTYAVDENFESVYATSGNDGKAVFYNLSARIMDDGKGYLYRLTEIESPKGYNCLEDPIYVTAPYTVDDVIHYSVTYTVVNTGIAYLPMSGFFGGVYMTMFLGIGLMAAAVSIGIIFSRRNKSLHRRM